MSHSALSNEPGAEGRAPAHPEATRSESKAVAFFCPERVNAAYDLAGAVTQVLASAQYILASQVRAFEAAFASYCGAAHAIALANGTDALELSLRALDVQPQDKVAMVANAGFYASAAALSVSAEPVYIDVDDATMLMCPKQLAARLKSERVDVIIVTHLYGQMADMSAILAVANAHGVPVVEDCAQAHGATQAGRRAGTWGAIGSFSFYPTKNLGAIGDAGALTTQDTGLATRLRMLRQYGWSNKYTVAVAGGRNSRMDELQAAVLVLKLPDLDRCNAARRDIASIYTAQLTDVPVTLPICNDAPAHVFHLYVIRTAHRDALAAYLAEASVATAIHYPIADHAQPVFAGRARPSLPKTQAMGPTLLSLPCYPGMPASEVMQVARCIRRFFEERAAPC